MNSICAVQPRILVADDQPDLIDALRLLLKREGIHDRRRRLAGSGALGSRSGNRSTCC